MYKYLIIFALFLVSSCFNGSSSSDYDKAVQYCEENGGKVLMSTDTNEEVCQYYETYDYDDGEHTYTMECELMTLYQGGDCSGINEPINELPLVQWCPTCEKTIREAFHGQVIDILLKLDHTGYVHGSQFILHPNYTDIGGDDIESYNLFLDCSGYVGYYVVQGIAKPLFDKVDTCYHSARPLAADFADAFAAADNITVETEEATMSDLDNPDNLCWGRVTHIKDAMPGDILVYKHPENIEGDTCDNYTVTGNTGHIMFIFDYPQKSTYYHNNEWLVKISDSTTSPHSSDSRFSNTCKYKLVNGQLVCEKTEFVKDGSFIYDKSQYKTNYYTAWTSRYNDGDKNYKEENDDWIELCIDNNTLDNNTFHRRCSDFGLETQKKIYPETKNVDSSTGIGVGYIYISDDMDYYRVKYGADRDYAEVYIGRPIKCNK
ncbi:hypothetical protein DEFDS_0731 [Deferribacter desulfuricans SSM1]|uniref:Lipoprotein n=1 Tax=Deferribacter desulfuricans (strain DSM 14783 / JCM 11476 / NBRC 101012 / SSM1) TaxID=639282 RepID=D3PC87_DEFDS|nr:hypothetical protein [Deferribacter desulfuricans]BAI80210.1 hypothetical protein DEFDS_0731 [Deferribacter desulfuricans SSM1]